MTISAMSVGATGSICSDPAAHASGGDDVRIRLRGSAQYPNAKGSAKYKDEGGEQDKAEQQGDLFHQPQPLQVRKRSFFIAVFLYPILLFLSTPEIRKTAT